MMKHMRGLWIVASLALVTTSACLGDEGDEPELEEAYSGNPSGETIVRWNEHNFTILTTLENGSPAGSQLIRELAMVHIAMHDAANAVKKKFDRYALDIIDKHADPALAAAAAAHDLLVAFRPSRASQVDTFFQTDLARVSSPTVRSKSLAIGAAAAEAILEARADDGFFDVVPYTFGPPDPGVYQPVPPANGNVAGVNFGNVTPFAMTSGSQFRPAGPPALNSLKWTLDYAEVKLLGRNDSTVRTADQTHAAQFWFETVQFGWNRIARGVATTKEKGLWNTARAFALMNMGIMDALIGVFDAKYHYEFWRPYTSIRGPVDDGNPFTVIDPTWLPLGNTPGHPEYPSAHAWLASAASVPLTKIYGSTQFTATSTTVAGSRNYNSFNHAVVESSDSRIWGGFHYRSSCTHGLDKGYAAGNYIYNNFLRPD
jgi:hypothetical protein